jgi:SAM-dependent methyltransferase
MANFIPLKNYMFYCLDQLIAKYGLTPPFLDIGCGIGDLSAHLALKGWQGEAMDSSEVAIKEAKNNLKLFPKVEVSKKTLYEENGRFKTIFIWDVVEHIKDDEIALKKVASLLLPSGHVLIAVPSNPKEWRWDDDFYGHYRRYTVGEMQNKLIKAGLEPVVFWDFTYPFFWVMRRLYVYFKSPPRHNDEKMDKDAKTNVSSTVNAWDIPVVSNFLNRDNFLWRLLYKFQFLFKNKLGSGCEIFVLARKSEK